MKKKQPENKTVRMTSAQARKFAKSEAGREALARIDAIPDDRIDISDTPERIGGSGGVRGL